jgi:hypothetical protein
MRLWIVVPVVALLMAGPLAATDGDRLDLTTGLRAEDPGTTPLPDADPVYDVLWDLTHGVYLFYEPTGDYSDVVALLAANGYVTTTTDVGVDNIDLSAYAVVVICVTSAWNSAYTETEVAALQDYMAQGGGILVMGENTDCPNENVNPVTQPQGVTCGAGYPTPVDLYFSDFAAHQLFDGVTTLFHRASGELSATGPGVPVAWTDAYEEMDAVVNPCQMIVTADSNFCDNDYLSTADNQQFVLNVFECLAVGSSPVESTTWGAIKALHR